MGAVISMKALLESGVHFGHRTNKWFPAMKPYIFTERNGIHIIDLQQTVKALNTAYNVVRDSVANGGTLLFVGTKRQAQDTIRDEATRAGMPYVTERWLGGMITNWTTIYQRIVELERLEHLRDSGEINRLTKKEGLLIQREITRLLTRLSGVRMIKKVPDLVFVVDVGREATAVHEANLRGIPVIALVDTNCDPAGVDYVIPSNDDAIRAIKLLVGKIADAVVEGKASRKEEEEEQPVAIPLEEASARLSAASARALLDDETELEDKDLLGEATLAKLGGSRHEAAEEAEEETPAEAEAVEEVVPKAEVVEEVVPEAVAVEETAAEETVASEQAPEEPASVEAVAEEPASAEGAAEEPVAEAPAPKKAPAKRAKKSEKSDK
jgi:small subunit ribosomal protein S2